MHKWRDAAAEWDEMKMKVVGSGEKALGHLREQNKTERYETIQATF